MNLRHVLVTGAHKGLGHALSAELLARGACVYALSRTEPDDLARHPGWRFVPCDLGDFAAIPAAVSTLLEGVDELDLAILNAGVLGDIKDLSLTSVDELRAVMDVNVWANKHLVDRLLDGSRRVAEIVGISSGAAQNGSGGWGAYSISKAALNLLLRVYSDEHPDVHFATVAPGVVYTDMIDYILTRPPHPHHPSLERIRTADGEGGIMDPASAAGNLLDRLDRIRAAKSGSFLDVRTMGD